MHQFRKTARFIVSCWNRCNEMYVWFAIYMSVTLHIMWTTFWQAMGKIMVGSALVEVGKKGGQGRLRHSGDERQEATPTKASHITAAMATYTSRSAPVFLSVWFFFFFPFFSPSWFYSMIVFGAWIFTPVVCMQTINTILIDVSDFKSLCCH